MSWSTLQVHLVFVKIIGSLLQNLFAGFPCLTMISKMNCATASLRTSSEIPASFRRLFKIGVLQKKVLSRWTKFARRFVVDVVNNGWQQLAIIKAGLHNNGPGTACGPLKPILRPASAFSILENVAKARPRISNCRSRISSILQRNLYIEMK